MSPSKEKAGTSPPADAFDHAARLRALIHNANEAYYLADNPIMSDAEYDRLFRELKGLERRYPSLNVPDSPTHRVGAEPVSMLAKHRHRVPMLSLANAFDDDELTAWEVRLAKLVPEIKESGYQIEIKIDGAAVNLTYEDGLLTVGATRGNGVVGENVTGNVRTIPDIPLRLRGHDWPSFMEVRGEVYFPLARFAQLNEQRAAAGDPPFANPRNSAAGSLRQLDPAVTRSRGLRFFAFHVEAEEARPFATQHEVLDALEGWGFRTAPHRRRLDTLDEVKGSIVELEPLIPTLDFQADGIVVKVDRLDFHPILGVVGGREPRWAIARKFAPEVAVTRLLDIRINVGRTGALNPYAVLEPVEVSGVTVSQATLHNFDLVEAKEIRIGDLVEVTRAGEVIPQVLGPVRERRDGSERPFVTPTKCPECGTPVDRPPDEVMYYCPNVACPGRVLEGIIHFASTGAMDIRGLGGQRVSQLVTAGLIHDVADLYGLTVQHLTDLEGFATKAATQLVKAIEASKRQPLSTLLFGLGIRHVGSTVAKVLADTFGTMDAIAHASSEAIGAVDGIGPTIAEEVTAFFAQASTRDLIERLRAHGLRFTEPAGEESEARLAGQTYVITGTLPTLPRVEATALIKKAGGRVTSSISKNTTALVVGESPGSKLAQARALGVETIAEAELLRRLGGVT